VSEGVHVSTVFEPRRGWKASSARRRRRPRRRSTRGPGGCGCQGPEECGCRGVECPRLSPGCASPCPSRWWGRAHLGGVRGLCGARGLSRRRRFDVLCLGRLRDVDGWERLGCGCCPGIRTPATARAPLGSGMWIRCSDRCSLRAPCEQTGESGMSGALSPVRRGGRVGSRCVTKALSCPGDGGTIRPGQLVTFVLCCGAPEATRPLGRPLPGRGCRGLCRGRSSTGPRGTPPRHEDGRPSARWASRTAARPGRVASSFSLGSQREARALRSSGRLSRRPEDAPLPWARGVFWPRDCSDVKWQREENCVLRAATLKALLTQSA